MYATTLIIYFGILILAGYLISRKDADFDSYFFGKRKVGSFMVFFTITASWFGAASTIATVNAAYKSGFNAVWLLGIPTIITLIIFAFLNTKIRNIHFISLPLLLKKYYGKPVATIASFLIFFYMVVLAASQLVAWGKFIGNFTNQSYSITIITGTAVIMIYSYMGGYLSIVLTDGIQFIMLTCAFLYLLIFFPGPAPVFKPTDFDFLANSHYNILMTISFTLAWTISPIIWQRIASAKSNQASRQGLIMSALTFAILYAIVITIGIAIRGIPITETGDLLGYIVKNNLPFGGNLLVFLGVAAAIMSTADTALNVASLTLVQDVLKINHKEKLTTIARWTTLLSGTLAIMIAIRFNSIIKTLGVASEIMAEGLFIPGMYLLFFKKEKPTAALLSLLLGGGFSLLVFLNAYGLNLPLPQWPYSLPYGLTLSLTGFLTGFAYDCLRQKKNMK